MDERKEDLIKKEIFRRYNSGITPLKSAEIENARYTHNETNAYFKKSLKKNRSFYKSLLELFFQEREIELMDKAITIEKVMEKIRFLLVIHHIPINYYARLKGRKEIISKIFENISNNINDLDIFYADFVSKIEVLNEFRFQFDEEKKPTNRLVYECLYWMISILEVENKNLDFFDDSKIRAKLISKISSNIDKYRIEQSHFYKEFIGRYNFTAGLFEDEFGINFDLYLNNKGRFKAKLEELNVDINNTNKIHQFESLRLNKPDASTTTIEDICRQMMRGRFLLRPSYQRGEAINKMKSSAIIESILLGVKLPPIFVYKRNDGISEVVDGQQRLLSILGFIGEPFNNEEGEKIKSEKDKFLLNKLTILGNLNGKKFDDLPEELREKIYDFNLSVVNIDERINPNFDPIDLFIRLNNKPYPIRENTFEMWNSYVDKDVISIIKENTMKHSQWFHVRFNNNRMNNEELYTTLAYLEYKNRKKDTIITDYLDIYRIGNKINSRIKDKGDITKLLNSVSLDNHLKEDFIKSIKGVETFIRKVKTLLIDKDTDDITSFLKIELDNLYHPKGNKARRTLQNFYVLWFILHKINYEMVKQNRVELKLRISDIFNYIRDIQDDINTGGREGAQNGTDNFYIKLDGIWSKYEIQNRKLILTHEERNKLIKKQENLCPLCNGLLFNGDDIEIDHIKPLSVGGRDTFLNLQATHKDCNRKKRNFYKNT
ncbi:HNH endonuclease family protein [Mesobacillus zeae]|uniref:DUF262 domain-containing protein n=4 Tax=Mesobacillus zeae TaxID=1917180 RepID=A0A398AWB3_9BACI|nr:DUF262 domain-containing protein [Mesobacillus zeae]RID81947.1 DUF262 domain-containing protein [Mesobacillus zeae]